MKYIEKIKVPVNEKHKGLSFCAIFAKGGLCNELYNTLHSVIHDKVAICELHGIDGISIEEAINYTNPDVVFEITALHLRFYKKEHLQKLLRNRTVIISDVEEGGIGVSVAPGKYEPLARFLVKNNILPKKAIYLTSGFLSQDIPDLNITACMIPTWLHISFSNAPYLIEVFNDSDKRQQLLDRVHNNETSNRILFPNRRARFYRVKFLSMLHKQGLLENIDWSLALLDWHIHNQQIATNQLFQHELFVEYPTLIHNMTFNETFTMNADDADLITEFLNSYELPKKLKVETTKDTYVRPADTWLGCHDWHINVETSFGHVLSKGKNTGSWGFVTEKTFKSFALGSMPISLNVPGADNYIRSLGFEVDDFGLDDLLRDERMNATADVVRNIIENNIAPNKDHIMHNAELCTDINFLVSMVTDPLLRALNDLH